MRTLLRPRLLLRAALLSSVVGLLAATTELIGTMHIEGLSAPHRPGMSIALWVYRISLLTMGTLLAAYAVSLLVSVRRTSAQSAVDTIGSAQAASYAAMAAAHAARRLRPQLPEQREPLSEESAAERIA